MLYVVSKLESLCTQSKFLPQKYYSYDYSHINGINILTTYIYHNIQQEQDCLILQHDLNALASCIWCKLWQIKLKYEALCISNTVYCKLFKVEKFVELKIATTNAIWLFSLYTWKVNPPKQSHLKLSGSCKLHMYVHTPVYVSIIITQSFDLIAIYIHSYIIIKLCMYACMYITTFCIIIKGYMVGDKQNFWQIDHRFHKRNFRSKGKFWQITM